MMKKIIIAVIAIFIVWSALDFIIHWLILKSSYEETSHLWRSQEEMKNVLMFIVTLLVSIFFVLIYAYLIKDRSMTTGLKYGLLFGLAAGISMGYGTYSYSPIPYHMALTWFLGTIVEYVVAGLLVGLIVKE